MGASISIPQGNSESVLDGPALIPPPGVVPNFDDAPNSNIMARAIMSTCLTIALIFFMVRTYSIWFVAKKPRISDYAMIPTFILYVAFIAIFFAGEKYGHFVHQYNVRLKDLPHILYLWTCTITLYAVELMMIKTVILLEWLYLFCPTGAKNSLFWWTAHALMVVNILFYLAALLALHLSCFPHARIWDKTLPGTCVDTRALDVTSAFVNVLVDVGILLLPQRVIWMLKMTRRKRIGVSAVFGLGIVVIGFAGTRTVFTILHAVRNSETADFTWNSSLQTLLFTVEMTLGIVIFCLPACPKAFASFSSSSLRPSSWFARLRSSAVAVTTAASSKDGTSDSNNGPTRPWPHSSWAPATNNRKPSAIQYGETFALHKDHGEYVSEIWLKSCHDSFQYFPDEQHVMPQWANLEPINAGRENHGMTA